MPPNQPDDQAHHTAGETEHRTSHECLLLGREGDQATLIVTARQPDHHAAGRTQQQTDTQALEDFTLPLDRDVHRRDLGALDRPHATGKLELDDECFVRGLLNGPNGLIQSRGTVR